MIRKRVILLVGAACLLSGNGGGDALLFHPISTKRKVARYTTVLLKLSDSRLEEVGNGDSSKKEMMIRLNKIFKATHSRRQADELIASGRVTVNNIPVTEKGGIMVMPYVDIIQLDGKRIDGWEALNGIPPPANAAETVSAGSRTSSSQTSQAVFEYVKYWKPRGVTCTTDRSVAGNILDEIALDGYAPQQRVFPVGRLDKDTSGLILLTNDGRLPNALLRSQQRKPKVYNVLVDHPLEQKHLEQLRNGVVITTIAQRDGKSKPLTAQTLPCTVIQKEPAGVQITLYEGRNRQIRKMMAALGYEVLKLHRIAFGDIKLHPLSGPGSWAYLNQDELQIVQTIILSATEEG